MNLEKTMQKFARYAAVGFLLLLTSCTTKAHLGYIPKYPIQASNNIQLVVEPFNDHRKKVDEIGSHRNLYGMPIIKVKTDDSVPDWMTGAFKAELTNAGYTILEKDQSSDYEIEGKIHQVYATTYFIYHGRMRVEIALKKNNSVLFQKEYQTKESGGANWMASPAGCANTIEINLQEICRQFIEDLSDFLHR